MSSRTMACMCCCPANVQAKVTRWQVAWLDLSPARVAHALKPCTTAWQLLVSVLCCRCCLPVPMTACLTLSYAALCLGRYHNQ